MAMRNEIPIPPALAAIAAGRDHIKTAEYAKVTDHATQTVRKNFSTSGHCFGVVPCKVGNILLWPVDATAKLLQQVQK